ncbi:TPA: hypothetical protein ACXIB4_003248 [Proteus mirabilis]
MSINILTNKQLHFALIHTIKASLNNQHVTKGAPCWAPPHFPNQGRLALTAQQIKENIKKIEAEEIKHRKNITKKEAIQCCKSLHASFFLMAPITITKMIQIKQIHHTLQMWQNFITPVLQI